MAGGPGSIYSIFSDAEMPYPTIALSDGTEVTINKAEYARRRASTVRADREAAFQAFWSAFDQFKQTFGVQLYSHFCRRTCFTCGRGTTNRLWPRPWIATTSPPRSTTPSWPMSGSNLDSFHRYLKLKKRMLGVETLKYSDVYAPVVKGVELQYTYDQAKDLLLDAVKPLGPEYQGCRGQGPGNERWIDVYPTPGKRSGAYSNGSAYDVHPYILLNYNGQYDDVSTLAHEMGHTMHSYYQQRAPAVSAGRLLDFCG